MITITLKHNIADAVRRLNSLQREQVPFATSLAINTTAKQVKEALQGDIRRIFDRPTRFTQNAVYMRPGKKSKPDARVFLKDDFGTSEHYLTPHVFGKQRRLKAFERKLQARGLLPKGLFVVPGAACPLDAYGNIGRGFINQVLSYLNASEMVAGSQSNTTARSRKSLERRLGKKLFGVGGLRGVLINYRGKQDDVGRKRAGKGGNVAFRAGLPHPGIWVRTEFSGGGDSIRPLFIYVRQPAYAKRWDFFGHGQRVIAENFDANFRRALARAMATAK